MLLWEITKEILEESAATRKRAAEQVRALEENIQEAQRNLRQAYKLREELRDRLILSRELIRSSRETIKIEESDIAPHQPG